MNGYVPETRTVSLFEHGTAVVRFTLLPTNPNAPVPGTVGMTAASGTATPAGAVTSTVTLNAPAPLPGTDSPPTLEIGAGTVLATEGGAPLTGALTTRVRFIDGDEGLAALPQDALLDAHGNAQDAVAAVLLTITDQNGNVARAHGGRERWKRCGPITGDRRRRRSRQVGVELAGGRVVLRHEDD